MKLNEMLALAFPNEEGPYDLYRHTYKYTPCGPSVGFCIGGKWVYCDGLRKFGRWSETEEITAICVSSIVEGVDQEVPARIIELKEMESPRALVEKFGKVIVAVDEEADEIWKATHGCRRCAERAGVDYESSIGVVPVWGECPDCEGRGEVI